MRSSRIFNLLVLALAMSAMLLTVSTADAAPPDLAPVQVAVAPAGTTPAMVVAPAPTPTPPPQVYLSGTRWRNDNSVGGFAQVLTASATVKSFADRVAKAGTTAAFDNFVNQIQSWPRSLPIFQSANRAGITSILDGSGKVLGTMDTFALCANGIPGLNYLGDPWGPVQAQPDLLFLGPSVVTVTTLEGKTLTLDIVAFVSVSPIIIDLQGDGKPDVDCGEWRPHPQRFNLGKARMFDIDGCGEPDLTEWVGPRSGILVAPLDEVKVTGGRQLFGTALGFVDGYQKLALLRDKNHDGQITGAELDGLKVWVDTNQDGRCQMDELRTVQEVGIESIRCTHQDMRSECTIRGQKRLTWDWWPTVAKVRKAASK